MEKPSYENLSIGIRALLVRSGYNRLIDILNTHTSGYELVLSEYIDEIYIRLLNSFRELLSTPGLESLLAEFPQEIPETLHDMGSEADMEWEYNQDALNSYKGKIIRFCVQVNAPRNDELEKILYESVDKAIAQYKEIKAEQNKKFVTRAKNIAQSVNIGTTQTSPLIPPAILERTRGYLESVIVQINGCYIYGYFDACSVMVRRLIETLLIECFESAKSDDLIKDKNGDFVTLDKLVSIFLSQPTWNVGRDAKKALAKMPKIKGMGDLSAHNRRYTAKKDDLDSIALELRVVTQELITIAFASKDRSKNK